MMTAVADTARDLVHVARSYGLCARLLTREGGRRPRSVVRLLLREVSALGWEKARKAAEDFSRALPSRAYRYASWLATNAVPAYEASYGIGARASGGLMATMADVAGYYRAFGFQVQDERPDYLGAQVEFLALLSLKEAHALLEGRPEEAVASRQTRAQFAHQHLPPWLPSFRERAQTAGLSCFAALADLVQALVEADLSAPAPAPPGR